MGAEVICSVDSLRSRPHDAEDAIASDRTADFALRKEAVEQLARAAVGERPRDAGAFSPVRGGALARVDDERVDRMAPNERGAGRRARDGDDAPLLFVRWSSPQRQQNRVVFEAPRVGAPHEPEGVAVGPARADVQDRLHRPIRWTVRACLSPSKGPCSLPLEDVECYDAFGGRGFIYEEKDGQVSTTDVQRVKQALLDAGVEIYRLKGEEIQVAERVRLHIMDSGVRVRLIGGVSVCFTARSQRSDFPNANEDDLFEKVRGLVGAQAYPRGYTESEAKSVQVTDPVDASKVLDVWHEVTFEKPADLDSLVDEVRWALELEKYVGR